MSMPTVLVVEDDQDNRQLLVEALHRAGFATRSTGDGRSAAGLARTAHAVLLDVSLPGWSGLDVCRQLRADPATAGLPVVLVSGHGVDQQVRAGLAAGADRYLVKPFSPAELVAELRRLLDPAAVASAASERARYATYRSGARLLAAPTQHPPAEESAQPA
jgi:DNA-binding response OmpR family regulator